MSTVLHRLRSIIPEQDTVIKDIGASYLHSYLLSTHRVGLLEVSLKTIIPSSRFEIEVMDITDCLCRDLGEWFCYTYPKGNNDNMLYSHCQVIGNKYGYIVILLGIDDMKERNKLNNHINRMLSRGLPDEDVFFTSQLTLFHLSD